jgi:hypothetical protein
MGGSGSGLREGLGGGWYEMVLCFVLVWMIS